MRERADLLTSEATRILRGAALVQATVLTLALVGAPLLLRARRYRRAPSGFRLAAVGAALQLMSLLEILLLYYFDLRREALAVSVALLVAELACITAARALHAPLTAGYALACLVAAGSGLWLVRSRMSTLVADTFQTQPFGNVV